MNALQHPVFVHLPMAAAILLPLLIAYGLFMDKKQPGSNSVWYSIAGFFAIASVAAFLSGLTGEMGEEVVEKMAPESAIEAHEEAASLFAAVVYFGTLVSIAIFFLKDKLQAMAKYLLLAVGFVIAVTGIRTGKLGGELVYKYDAPAALIQKFGTAGAPDQTAWSGEDDDDDDDDDDD